MCQTIVYNYVESGQFERGFDKEYIITSLFDKRSLTFFGDRRIDNPI